jgi:hypothetical protein
VLEQGEQVFIGGARWPTWGKWWWPLHNSTWPSVELRLFNGRARVQLRWAFPRGLVERWFPPVEVELSQATVAPVSPAGVRISTPDNMGIIFWTFSPNEVLDALLERGGQLGEPDELPL